MATSFKVVIFWDVGPYSLIAFDDLEAHTASVIRADCMAQDLIRHLSLYCVLFCVSNKFDRK
jgi:hypothetical protein